MRGKDAMTIRVLITDDHKAVRRGLRGFLGLDPDLEVVGETSNGEEALHLAQRLAPDVVLMDLLMPVMDGIEATGRIRHELPDVEVVALTNVLEDASVTGRSGREPSAISRRPRTPTSCARRSRPRPRGRCISPPRGRHA
jgi:DNA-binding NarL/FixJ family response regulator